MPLGRHPLVLYEGKIVANVHPDEITVNELGMYMAGSKTKEAAV